MSKVYQNIYIRFRIKVVVLNRPYSTITQPIWKLIYAILYGSPCIVNVDKMRYSWVKTEPYPTSSGYRVYSRGYGEGDKPMMFIEPMEFHAGAVKSVPGEISRYLFIILYHYIQRGCKVRVFNSNRRLLIQASKVKIYSMSSNIQGYPQTMRLFWRSNMLESRWSFIGNSL